MEKAPSFRSGFVTIIGKPNVGKSTILNALVGEKISITSKRPETTRDRILGICNFPNGQLIFVDTPGFRKPSLLLDKNMMKRIKESLDSTDLVLAVIHAFGVEKEDRRVFSALPTHKLEKKIPVFLLINKIDRVDKTKLLPLIKEAATLYPFVEVIPISALKGDNMDVLFRKTVDTLPVGPRYYPENLSRGYDEAFAIKELIREKILHLTYQEVPHCVAVFVEEITEREDGLLTIYATIFVERESQKAIVIGQKGNVLKKVGENARRELEKYFGKKIFLNLWVKVLKDWRQDEQALRRLGYVL